MNCNILITPQKTHISLRGRFCYKVCQPYSTIPVQIPRDELSNSANSPKAFIDVKSIRENAAHHKKNCLERNYITHATYPERISDLTEKWRLCQTSSRMMRERSNWLTRQLASTKISLKEGAIEIENTSRDMMLSEARSLKEQLSNVNMEQSTINEEINYLAMAMPNLSSDETPRDGLPREVGYINEHLARDYSSSGRCWRSHIDIGLELNLIDLASAAITSGWGWYYLLNEAVQLEQALVQFALSIAKKRGWSLVSPPSMVYSHISDLCGYQPRDHHGEKQVYQIQQKTSEVGQKPQLALAGTSEIPLASMKANHIFEANHLPLKYFGVSRCYRAEAGGRGTNTKGLYRVHEFTKVEMFAWTLPDSKASGAIFDEMCSIQEEILGALQLHCRILEMPSVDLGASAARKRDIEASFPSRQARSSGWGEVTSVSSCTDYQTRRLATRLRPQKQSHSSELLFPYTLNGTALAVPRVLAAILENGWVEEKSEVMIPKALQPWMDGAQVIGRSRK